MNALITILSLSITLASPFVLPRPRIPRHQIHFRNAPESVDDDPRNLPFRRNGITHFQDGGSHEFGAILRQYVKKFTNLPTFDNGEGKVNGKKKLTQITTKSVLDLFDRNGMIFLSEPKDSNRELNKLMNKVVNFNMNKKKNGKRAYLRKQLFHVFKPDEIKRLNEIWKALRSGETTPALRTDFNFSDLVI